MSNVTSFGDKLLRYPTDMVDQHTDYFQIEVLKNAGKSGGFSAVQNIGTKTVAKPTTEDPNRTVKKGTGGFLNLYQGDRALQASEKYSNLPTSHVIILPIPSAIKDNNGATWGESKLNDFAAWGLSKIGEAMESETAMDLLKSPWTIGQRLIDGATGTDADIQKTKAKAGNIINYGKMVAAAGAANALGANVTVGGLLSRSSGQIINQNLEMVFSGVTIRTFNFGWDLVPRDKDESNHVLKIIKILKRASAAKMRKDNTGFLNAPDLFRIKYMKGGGAHPFLNRFKTCVLKNMGMSYTGSGTYATYRDGTPVHMKMDLTFQELNPIYAEDHDKVDKGVGY